jgi:hypothetical protein
MASSRPTKLEIASEPSQHDSTRAHSPSVAKPHAPEDVRPGDHLALLDEMFEYPSCYWFTDATWFPRHELIRLRVVPRDEARPLKVVSVCPPFVFTTDATGNFRTLDLRRIHVACLSRDFADRVRKALKKKPAPTS